MIRVQQDIFERACIKISHSKSQISQNVNSKLYPLSLQNQKCQAGHYNESSFEKILRRHIQYQDRNLRERMDRN